MTRFIAAMDHSGGSTGGVLERYGQEYTEDDKMDLVHEMRMRMVNSPDFNDKNIWAAIMYRDSVERGLAQIMNAKGIKSFLKVDSGCEDNGYLKYFRLAEMIKLAIDMDCYGTKMRSIIKDVKDLEMIMVQQFALAKSIDEAGLMPIIEPEVPINHPEKSDVEVLLEDSLHRHLETYPGKCILKLTPPEVPNLYHNLTTHPSVSKVVFLSGGYSTSEACSRLSLNDNVSASFSRALSQDLYYNLTDDEFDATISNNIKMITEASE